MQDINSISNLKLRASWGQLGNQNVPLFSFVNSVNIGQGHNFNDTVVPGAAVTTISDPNISWETTTITNIGLDVGLWNNKLEIIADIFNKETTDILARSNIPSQVGNLRGPITNLYSMSNKGVEVGTNYINSVKGFNYNFGANITYIHNNVDFLNGDEHYDNNMFGSVNIIKEGYPVNSYYLYESMGIFKTQEEVDNHATQGPTTAPGDIIYRDVNEDGVINNDDKVITGRSVPKYTYGFNFGLDFKGFDLAAFFQGVQDINIYPIHNWSFPNFNGAGISKDHLANSWTPENPDAPYPRLTLPKRGSQANYQNSTFWLQDASYLRLKNLQIGYSIPSALLDRIKIRKLRIFANAQNLLTFSDYKATDPEKEILRGTAFDYPSTKIFSLGCNINF
jgi:TonB-linked SusC/RagA family outer membrane protein